MTFGRRAFAWRSAIWLGVAWAATIVSGCSGEAPGERRERPPPGIEAGTDRLPAAPPRPAPRAGGDAAAGGDATAVRPAGDAQVDADAHQPGPPPRSGGAPVDAATLDAVRAQILAERRWASLVTAPTNEFVTAIGPRFDEWSRVLIALSAAGQRAEADELCEAVMGLRAHWGPAIFPIERFDAFIRDRFWAGSRRLEAAQFFEPLRLHPGDARILTLYRLSLYEGDQVIARYYLERITIDQTTRYALGRVEAADGEHVDVAQLGAEEPSYWTVRDRTLLDAQERSGAGRP
jgi:hypothetical protein